MAILINTGDPCPRTCGECMLLREKYTGDMECDVTMREIEDKDEKPDWCPLVDVDDWKAEEWANGKQG